ncbi:MAG: hypothetical protein HQK77_21055 [Desulfobacterales bacterium]|nr:hypothetical protein [Desulfobacterales bacterium]
MKKNKKSPPSEWQVSQEISQSILSIAKDKEIACHRAFELAKTFHITPQEIGYYADHLSLGLTQCQLGLFGYHPDKKKVHPSESVSENLTMHIQKALDQGKLSCINAWAIAESLNISKFEVSSACEAMNIKISSCQIGAF